MIEPIWLRLESVLILHHESLDEHGGLDGIRDQRLLDSALARARNLYLYERVDDFSRLAAAYGCGIARNRPFNDGNKRAAFIAATLFLPLNGFAFSAPQVEATQVVLKMAGGEMTEEGFAGLLSLDTTCH